LGCAAESEQFTVLQSGPAVKVGADGFIVTNAFSKNQEITVNVNGFGAYEYSLDNGVRQTSNVFENVSFGAHTIQVWDVKGGIENGCEKLNITNVQVIDYPLFFTPNGDGVNDIWNIVDLGEKLNAKIYIFDRYGKLLKEITSKDDGWDGTFVGKPQPSDDYWFMVEYVEEGKTKQFRAHFSLKR
jgi:gliding motility-associated-like protein